MIEAPRWKILSSTCLDFMSFPPVQAEQLDINRDRDRLRRQDDVSRDHGKSAHGQRDKRYRLNVKNASPTRIFTIHMLSHSMYRPKPIELGEQPLWPLSRGDPYRHKWEHWPMGGGQGHPWVPYQRIWADRICQRGWRIFKAVKVSRCFFFICNWASHFLMLASCLSSFISIFRSDKENIQTPNKTIFWYSLWYECNR